MARSSVTTPADVPLLAWGDARQAQREHRRRIAWRAGAATVLSGLLLASIAVPPRPMLVWNASASAPTGLYFVTKPAGVRRGNTVLARLPLRFRELAAQRHYLPPGVLLVKQVAAIKGSQVCAAGRLIRIDGKVVAQRQLSDARGRRMPAWSGCFRLGEGQLFLLMARNRASFDGRYFGLTRASDLVGKGHLLWSR